MNAIRVETTVEADGELHLTQLPCQRGDRVEAIVLILESSCALAPDTDQPRTVQQMSQAWKTITRPTAEDEVSLSVDPDDYPLF
jgi:hypothetical protein